jgi:anhydro-N-acetylmuramic acid kinase
MLAERLCALSVRLTTTEEYDIPIEAKEALGFALLAYQTFHHRPGNVPQATGAKRAVILGKISFAS